MARQAQTTLSASCAGADGSLHALAWLVWAVAAAASVQLATNPLYTMLVIGVSALVVETWGSSRVYSRAFPILVSVGIFFALLRTVLTALTTHNGVGTTVLFHAPELTLPKLLGAFTIGGSVELEVLLQALTEGLAVVAIMAVFGAFNAVASHYELLQSAPRAFYELGLVVTVALAFVPSTLASIATVREADRCRTGGKVVRRGRLVRQVVPLVEMGLERAMALAESMDARGFGHGGVTANDRVGGWCGLGALLALGGGFVALVGRETTVAAVLGVVGVVFVGAAVLFASRQVGRPRYRPRRLGRDDRWLMAGALVAPAGLAVLSATGDHTLTWFALPLHWPQFGVLPVLALTALVTPVVLVRRERRASVVAVSAAAGTPVGNPA